ncbi:DNA-directed RNA polymerase subunit F, partial [Thermoplasmatales archaeon SW_10_69_26]
MIAVPLDDAEALSIPEVHHLLEKERANRGELSYEQKLSLDHAKAFDRLGSKEDAEELLAELTDLDRVTRKQAIKIVDILPTHEDE